MSHVKCAVCYCDFVVNSEFGENSGGNLKIGLQLDVIFLLRKVLEVPVDRLESYLRRCGDPEHWVKLCYLCSFKVTNVREIFAKLQALQRQFQLVKWELQKQVRDTFKAAKKGGGRSVRQTRGIVDECRATFVKKKGRGHSPLSNPFVKGDIQASKLALETGLAVKSEGDDWLSSKCRNVLIEGRNISSEPTEQHNQVSSLVMDTKRDPDFDPTLFPDDENNDDFPVQLKIETPNYPTNTNDSSLLPRPSSAGVEVSKDVDSSHSPSPPKPASKAKRKYDCTTCNKSYLRKVSLRNHVLRDHEGRLEHICHICGVGLVDQRFLRRHIISFHTFKSTYKCRRPNCNAIFPNRVELRQHLANEHAQEKTERKKRYRGPKRESRCDLCDRTFTDYHYLKSHIRIVHERNYSLHCPECGKGMYSSSQLKMHMKVHDPGPFICEVETCPGYNQKFDTKKELMSHRRKTHPESGNTVICAKCGKGLLNKEQLRQHDLKMHGEGRETNPHVCVICHKKFGNWRYLNYHVRYTHKMKTSEMRQLQLEMGKDEVSRTN